MTAQVAMTRVEAKAMWLADILRPANIRLPGLAATHERSGIS
jgi:hypothetical protein